MSNRRRILIAGGLSAGPSAAAKARRCDEDAEIILFEKREHISYAVCGMPYVIGGLAPGPESLLVHSAPALARRFDIRIKTGAEAVVLDAEAGRLRVREGASEIDYPYDSLVICTGADPIRLRVPGAELEGVFTLRWYGDLDPILERLAARDTRQAAVIGAGAIGLELAENLRELGLEVTLIEQAPHALPALDADLSPLLGAELEANGVRLLTGVGAEEFLGRGGKVSGVRLETGEVVPAQVVFTAVGVRPNSGLASAAGLELGASGAIAVDEYARTSAESVFAAGDCAETTHIVTGKRTWLPLATVAQRQGRAAGANAAGRSMRYMGALGTFIVKLFELEAAGTGLGEAAARAAGFETVTAFVAPPAIAAWYPDAALIRLKLVADRHTGLLLGAQAVGARGVDKRIDVAAAAIMGALSVDDLFELDLAYAPPFNTAKDPVVHAGMTAANIVAGEAAALDAAELKRRLDQGDKIGLLDVRPAEAFGQERIPGSVSIPLELLRRRLDELDRNAEWVVVCRQGQLAYFAALALTRRGFGNVKFLTGSLEAWKASGYETENG